MDFGTVDIGFSIACKWVSWSSHHVLLAHQMQGPCVGVSRAATVVASPETPNHSCESQRKMLGKQKSPTGIPIRRDMHLFRLFLEESGENWSSIGVFDHSHRVDFKQIPPLGSALIKGNGVVGLE